MAKLKPGWKRVKFGEIAVCVNDRVDDPASAGVERYVGLEHLDPESLVIRRWGTPDDVESTKLRFRSGDIIFGKRRAYQRKLAVADFEGICSAHAMVLRAKPGKIVPEFLPFFMQSDVFMERAKAISVGSLSPTINWKTLEAEEFALPPVEEQRRIVAALNVMNVVLETQREASQRLVSVAAASFPINAGITVRLADICELITDGDHNPPERVNAGVPHIVVRNIVGMQLVVEGCTFVSPADYKRVSRRYAPRGGDIVVTCVGTIGAVAMVPDGFEFSADRSLALCRPDRRRVLPTYLMTLLAHPHTQTQMLRVSRGTAQKHLYLASLRELSVCVPALDVQHVAAAQGRQLQEVASALARRTEGIRRLSTKLLQFEGR